MCVPKNLTDDHETVAWGIHPSILAHNTLTTTGRAFSCTPLLDGMNHGLIKRNSKTKKKLTWKHPYPLAKKFASPLSLREIAETVFWDHQGKLLVDFLDRGDMQRLSIIVVHLRDYSQSFVAKGLSSYPYASSFCSIPPELHICKRVRCCS